MYSKLSHHLTAFGTAALISIAGAPVQAAWEFRPEVKAQAGVDDNVRLTRQDEDEASLATAEIVGIAKNVTETSDWTLTGGARFVEYSGTNLDGTNAQFVTADGVSRGERSSFGLNARARRDSLLRYGQIDAITGAIIGQEIPDFTEGGIGEPGDIDRGLIEDQVRRTFILASPYFEYLVNARTRVRLTYNYYGYTYDSDGERLGLQDTDSNGINAKLFRRISERDTLSFSVGASRIEPDRDRESDNYDASVGWIREVSETTSFYVDVGANRVETESDAFFAADKDTGLMFRSGFYTRMERGIFSFNAERTNWPNGFGDISEVDNIYAYLRYDLSPRWASETFVQYTGTNSNQSDIQTFDRDYYELSQQIEYALTEEWSVGVEYRYRRSDRDGFSDEAHGNAVFASIAYRPRSQF